LLEIIGNATEAINKLSPNCVVLKTTVSKEKFREGDTEQNILGTLCKGEILFGF
jgi:hypothetical protein